MKIINLIFKLSAAFIAGILVLTVQTYAQKQTAELEKEFSLKPSDELLFHCYESDLTIKTREQNGIKLTGTLTVEGGDKTDREKFINVFQNPEIKSSKNSLEIDTRIYKTRKDNIFFTKYKLVNGENVSIDAYTAKLTLWIPENQNINLKSKYNKIVADKLSGEVKMELYNAEIEGENFGKDYKLQMKYSEADFKKGANGKITLYDSEVGFESVGNVDLSTKYSEVKIGNAIDVKIDSYEDNITFHGLNNMKGNAKYSEIQIKADMEKNDLELYDCKVKTKNVKIFTLESKYSEIKAGIVGIINANKLYDNNIEAKGVVKLDCNESKYDEFKIVTIRESLQMTSAYDTDIYADNVSGDFQLFKGKYKYCNIELPLSASMDYKLEFKSKYGTIDFPEDRFSGSIKSIKDSEIWEFKGKTSKNPACTIDFESYDSDIELK